MSATRIFLLVQAVIFLGFGLFVFFKPEYIMDLMGAPSMNSNGIYELRGIYGGVSVGAGLLFLSGFLKVSMERPALFFVLAYAGGYVLARIAALPLGGMPSGMMPLFVGFEAISAAIAWFLLRGLKSL